MEAVRSLVTPQEISSDSSVLRALAVHFGVTERSFCDTTRQRMQEELQRRNYTTDTIRGYIHAIKDFAKYFGNPPELMGADEVREFQLYMIREKKLALDTVALRMGALRFLYRRLCAAVTSPLTDLAAGESAEEVPVVLSQEEVVGLIEAALNLRHRMILCCFMDRTEEGRSGARED